MNNESRHSPHGGIQRALDMVLDRLALASEIATTDQVDARETEALFARYHALTRYMSAKTARSGE